MRLTRALIIASLFLVASCEPNAPTVEGGEPIERTTISDHVVFFSASDEALSYPSELRDWFDWYCRDHLHQHVCIFHVWRYGYPVPTQFPMTDADVAAEAAVYERDDYTAHLDFREPP